MKKFLLNVIGGIIGTGLILGIFCLIGLLENFLLNHPFWFGVAVVFAIILILKEFKNIE